MGVNLKNPIFPKYSVLYCDPPWNYKRGPGGRGAAGKYYDTLTTPRIAELPVQHISADDSVLALWATGPCLPDALYVMNCWGFEYVTTLFTWVKRNKKSDTLFWGTGHHTRSNPEYVLLGRKGKGLKRQSARVHSVVEKGDDLIGEVVNTRIQAHSVKPVEVRDRIEELWGLVPRVELFGREVPDDWAAWGNECEVTPELELFGWPT